MSGTSALTVDVAIFGGGIAGLWLLDALHERGYVAVLLESAALGAGQTIASQGIIHGGLKYTLDGLFSESAAAIAEMPRIWRECAAGTRRPALPADAVRASHCHLWRTSTWASRLGMLGARAGLRVRPERLEPPDWPSALAGCPGEVFRLDEQVFDLAGVLAALAEPHRERLIRYLPESLRLHACRDAEPASRVGDATGRPSTHPGLSPTHAVTPVAFEVQIPGNDSAATAETLNLRAERIVLTAGAGNETLRAQLGLSADAAQRRSLHMVLVRGPLPALNGHCTDGAQTRVTITTVRDRSGQIIWQVGGQVAEEGVRLTAEALCAHAARELRACLPSFDPVRCEFATYRVDRAEAATPGGRRPSDVVVRHEPPIVTAWPTKLALAPRLAERVMAELPPPALSADQQRATRAMLPALGPACRPAIATPPWDSAETLWRTATPAAFSGKS